MIENSSRVIGILAHVDAGKTTLSEALLFTAGNIRKAGRVDHGDAFLDTDEMEKERGITIFSKQARLSIGDRVFTLLDTPGHGDLSAEMERTLQVLDACILVISAADGINGHVRMLWKLLEYHSIPVFIFVNKMDQPGADRDALLAMVKSELSAGAVDFTGGTGDLAVQEEIAVLDDKLLEKLLEGSAVTDGEIRELVRERKMFPVWFGSALKMNGIEELEDGLVKYLDSGTYGDTFSARVFKITREDGTRLTWLKVTGGILRVRDVLPGNGEKVSQLRLYSGVKFTPVQEVRAGDICAAAGLTNTFAGQIIADDAAEARYGSAAGNDNNTGSGSAAAGGSIAGNDSSAANATPRRDLLFQPVQTFALIINDGTDIQTAMERLRELEEEEPLLNVSYNSHAGEIQVSLMGRIQAQILKRMISERYGMDVDFGQGSVVYRETISAPVEGVGHYEPLRHYSEVHIMMEPGPPGSGIRIRDACLPDTLEGNFRRLILKHLAEKKHHGVLTGAEITDMKISLIAGAASPVHTEGGDFRQSTYRAVRQGLMTAMRYGKTVLLEPVMDIRLDVPDENLGRALSDLQQMGAKLDPPETDGRTARVTGVIPASTIGDYPQVLASFTHGEGSFFSSLRGYEPCHNAEEVIEASGYVPDEELEEPASSIFCAHGAAVLVPWDKVREYMHIDTGWNPESLLAQEEDIDGGGPDGINGLYGSSKNSRGGTGQAPGTSASKQSGSKGKDPYAFDKELMAIFERTYGPVKNRSPIGDAAIRETKKAGGGIDSWTPAKNRTPERSYLLVDGYNIIFAWENLKELALDDIGAARDRLLDILSDFAGYCKDEIIVVFDAYRVTGGRGEIYRYHNIDVVYTKEAETADLYIEKTSHELAVKKHYRVTVATSDAIEQVIIFGTGALRLSAWGLLEEIIAAREEMRDRFDIGDAE
ncbi:MAG: TetM/TetW/TetO/TetS family tetracycline resistance ribosomal protection protein [Lachnospiraceae bacterium]|nr:TetM/TetW/TetO/TetS family tetracycline resistance ribosomal protection protein [Lachnospiraceae bacterium]